ncbi:thioesterase II family protein [Herbaspirillum rhizosphaerae]|uniref:thioesterase II family protein n=1 Tax=Herbaspirillum rhizosphaerae TaxID=346179 RepID=UPI00067BE19A|nr:alpha/beta fold hydrolase [Herbaspirillum rhizosphaerae]
MSEAAVNLFCLPYAGAGAAVFREWRAKFPAWINPIPLHLPARGIRQQMAPIHQWPPLIDLLMADVMPHLDRPFAIFGHSMGALIAVELAHAIRARLQQTPILLCASACEAPSHRQWNDGWLSCSRDDLLSELQSLNSTLDDLLANEEFMALVLPMIRADFHLCGTYRRRERAPLASQLLVLAGRRDKPHLCDPELLRSWSSEVSGVCRTEILDGDHFFMNSHRQEVVDRLVAALSDASIANRCALV